MLSLNNPYHRVIRCREGGYNNTPRVLFLTSDYYYSKRTPPSERINSITMHKMSSTTVTAKPLSLLGKLDLLLGFFGIAIAGFVAVFTGLWRSERDAPTYYLHIAYAVLRKVTERYSPLQLQLIFPACSYYCLILTSIIDGHCQGRTKYMSSTCAQRE